MAGDRSKRVDLDIAPDTLVGAVVEPDVTPPFVAHEHRRRDHRQYTLRPEHRTLLLGRLAHQLGEHVPSPEQVDETGERRSVGVQVVGGIVEDLPDTGGVPLRLQVHPEAPLRVAHVLEQVRAVGARGGAQVLQHLLQPARAVTFPSKQSLRRERDSAEHGLTPSRGISHVLRRIDPGQGLLYACYPVPTWLITARSCTSACT